MLYGAIIGDIVGSRYENDYRPKTKDFELFTSNCRYTDDTVMTCAIYQAMLKINKDMTDDQIKNIFTNTLQEFGKKHINAGYGSMFSKWIKSNDPKPYNSFGNGSAMRVSSIGWLYNTLEEVEKYAKLSAEITHNHEEGIKGAQAIAGAIFIARTTKSKRKVKKYIKKLGYNIKYIDFYKKQPENFDVTCQGTIPITISAFLYGKSFEDVIRNAILVGGDTDTNACIAGSIAEAFYNVPNDFKNKCEEYLSDDLKQLLNDLKPFLN